MINSEQVIKGMEVCNNHKPCKECPYKDHIWCASDLERDALILLKEQEKIINKYKKADAFLAAHGWKWKNYE